MTALGHERRGSHVCSGSKAVMLTPARDAMCQLLPLVIT
jgi:hypothetical protein